MDDLTIIVVAAVLVCAAAVTTTSSTNQISQSSAKVSSIPLPSAKRRRLFSGESNHTVYTLVDSEGTVQYVGRTTDPEAREKAHALNPFRSGLSMNIVAEGLDYCTSRGMEQILMLTYHTINSKNKMNNQINGISLTNPNLETYLLAAKDKLGYGWNQVSNEVLNWLGL